MSLKPKTKKKQHDSETYHACASPQAQVYKKRCLQLSGCSDNVLQIQREFISFPILFVNEKVRDVFQYVLIIFWMKDYVSFPIFCVNES